MIKACRKCGEIFMSGAEDCPSCGSSTRPDWSLSTNLVVYMNLSILLAGAVLYVVLPLLE